MSVELVDAATIMQFLDDEEAFNRTVEARFARLDTNHDGVLSYEDLLEELKRWRIFETADFGSYLEIDKDEVNETYKSLFLKFDRDNNGVVDFEEFKVEIKNMMLGIASGLGFLPVRLVIEENSLLFNAVQRESCA